MSMDLTIHAVRDLMSPEFQEIFGAVGEDTEVQILLQKIIVAEDVKSVFALLEGMKTKTFNRPRFMRRQYSTGSQPVDVNSCTLSYSKNTNNCKFKFGVSNKGIGYCDY